jgi:hypothetical protein
VYVPEEVEVKVEAEVTEEVEVKVEAEVTDPSQYQMLDAPQTRSKHKALGPPEELRPQSRPALNTIEVLPTSHSVSEMSTAVKRRRVTSAPTSTPLCYVFLTYHCAHNGLSLGPSFLLRHPLPSRTDYDSSLIPIVTHY